MDDFLLRALIAGAGVAIVAGPFGCFVVWRRMAYFGDTLAHAALLGVAVGLAFELDIMLAVFLTSAFVSLVLVGLRRRGTLSSDAILGLLSHSALALGLVALAFMTWLRIDLKSFLFGDILAVTWIDIGIIYGGGAVALFGLVVLWRRLFASTVSPELAAAEGLQPERTDIAFMLLMALVIAIAMKIVGVLLITALLIIPAASARRFAYGPEQMAVVAGLMGVLAVGVGLYGSLEWDTPAGPSIVVAAFFIFLLSLTPIAGQRFRGVPGQQGQRSELGGES